MNTVVQQRLDRWLRIAAPLLSILLISFLGLINLPFPNYTTIAPAYTLIAVYCWTVWRPDLVPYVGVFAIGVFEDFLRGTPVGATSLLLLLTQVFVRSQRRFLFGRTFDTFWVGFAIIAVAVALLEWIVMSIAYGTPVAATAAIFRYLLTIAVFPVLSVLLLRLLRSVQHHT
jgi:rod shape-determining protein MreD